MKPRHHANSSGEFQTEQEPSYYKIISRVIQYKPPHNLMPLTVDSPMSPNPANPELLPTGSTGRVMILCFDGTGCKQGAEQSYDTNVLRFFRALTKNEPKKQIVYYQRGIGSYDRGTFKTHVLDNLSMVLDLAIAYHLDDHVKKAYTFIIQNYRAGDKLCLFGFSRGAHTARVVAGMIYKVGILAKDNIEHVRFAFDTYKATGYEGYKLSRDFKQNFAAYTDVTVQFIGVWDTVSSVGLIPEPHPFSSIHYCVKYVRHALALDEYRCRFRPDLWCEVTSESEQELDLDAPDDLDAPKPHDTVNAKRDNIFTERDLWEYKPKKRARADVKEVWFSGEHIDVGGGSSIKRNEGLSLITLRWMIKECFDAETGIMFDKEHLKDELFVDYATGNEIKDEDEQRGIKRAENVRQIKYLPGFPSDGDQAQSDVGPHIHDMIMLVARWAFGELIIRLSWALLEFVPLLAAHQDHRGNWFRRRMPNLGRGRFIPFDKNKVLVHTSVKDRLERTGKKIETQGEWEVHHIEYKPQARNWDAVMDSGMLKYVD